MVFPKEKEKGDMIPYSHQLFTFYVAGSFVMFSRHFISVTNVDAMTLGLLKTTKRISALTLTNARLAMAAAECISARIITEAINASVYPDTRGILRECIHPSLLSNNTD